MEKGWLKLEDRVVIVTGGASGIARHTVQTLVAAGAKAVSYTHLTLPTIGG